MDELPANASVVVPYWSYLVPVAIAVIAAIQAVGTAWMVAKIKDTTTAVRGTTIAVNHMEAQINSNMERQIRQAIAEAIANERLRVQDKTLAVAEEQVTAHEIAEVVDEAVVKERQRVKDEHDDEMM